MLINLIGNAIDAYADAPANTARIVKVSGAQDGDFIVLTVADRAGGIPPAVMGRIFEPFFTTKPVGKGTGLGLALVFGTVSDMGGTVAVRNENGGAVFEIRLPRAHEEPMEAEAHEHAPAGEHAV